MEMSRKIRVIETDMRAGKMLQEREALEFRPDKPGTDGQEGHILNVYDQVQYQEILGFGGAFTESSTLNYQKVSEEQRQKVLELYFDKEKGLSLIHI